jgi:hypothetical protein
VAVSSLGGLLIPDMYVRETADWQAQSVAQDLFDLIFAVPILLISAWLFTRGSLSAFFMLTGVLIFLIYTFIIYTLGLHFNRFFLLYCFTLALSSYTLIYLLWQTGSAKVKTWFHPLNSVTAPVIYLLFFAILFYALWLSEIIPALVKGIAPVVLDQTGLFTNPVHVLDLSFLLPGFVITAFLLRKRHALGYVFAPAIMTFSVVMTISIATLLFYEYSNGYIADYMPAIAMIFFSMVSIFMFVRFTSELNNNGVKKELHESFENNDN